MSRDMFTFHIFIYGVLLMERIKLILAVSLCIIIS